MTAPLRRVLVCPPDHAGWHDSTRSARWRQLGFLRKPQIATAAVQHETMCRTLTEAGVEILRLPSSESFSLDAIYTHDASFITDFGAIVLRMGKPARSSEPAQHLRWYESNAIPILGGVLSPGTVEAGDLVWLDEKTLLAGRGYRTNLEGLEQLRGMLASFGVAVISAPLPHGSGPESCLHLMSLLSLLDEHTALVDLKWLAVETVQLLHRRDFSLIEIEETERETLACNVLALGNHGLLAFEENAATNHKLGLAGFQVMTVRGSEIGINGGGGPTCLTRPVLRRI